MFVVFSKAHFGPVAISVRSAMAVVRYAERLRRRGDEDIRVGSSLAESVPFDVWLLSQPGLVMPADRRPR